MAGKKDRDTDFGAFVKRQQTDERVDWAKERDEWLGHLEELYGRTESFLAEYIKNGEIKLEYRDIALNEENIGSYRARQMVLRIGRQQITMTPLGTRLLFTKGGVDVEGSAGRFRLVLVDGESSAPKIKATVGIGGKRVWKIMTSPPVIGYIEFTRESLFQALMEVANG